MRTTLLFNQDDNAFLEETTSKKGFISKQLMRFLAGTALAASVIGMTPALAANNLLFKSDFETGKIQGWSRQDGKIPGAITVQSNIVRSGKHAVKLHMKKCSWVSPLCSPKPVNLGKARAQLGNGGGLKLPLNKSMWLGYSIFFPKDFVSPNLETVAGVNAHNSAGGPGDCQKGGAQPFSFRLLGNKYLMRATTEGTSNKRRIFDLATIKKGQWTDVTMNWKWSYGNDGFFKIWINGVQKVDFKGSTMCRATLRLDRRGGLPYLNATNYFANWGKEANKSINSLTLYLDEIRVGGPSASYSDVAPGGKQTIKVAPKKQPPQVKAGSDKASGTTKSTTNAATKPLANQGKRKLYSSCNIYKGKARDACARAVTAYNKSLAKPKPVQTVSAQPKQPVAVKKQARPNRVKKGIVVYYDFEEGRGSTVRDVSKVGQPLNLKILNTRATSWVPGGLMVDKPTQVFSSKSASKLANAVRSSGEITIEAWIAPDNKNQKGPARVVTISSNGSNRNLTLGQDSSKYQVRLRTTTTGNNGTRPFLETASNNVFPQLSHVVYTRSKNGVAKLYVNGRQKAGKTIAGKFSNWNGSYRLVLANEKTGGRAWLGEYQMAAFYNRALSSREIIQNFRAGPADNK